MGRSKLGCDASRSTLALVFDIEEVISQIIFGSGIRFAFKEFGKLSEHTDVGFLSSLAFSAKLQVLLHSQCDGGESIWIIVFGHGRLLLETASEQRRLEIDVEKQSLTEEPLWFKEIDSAKSFAEKALARANAELSITELPR